MSSQDHFDTEFVFQNDFYLFEINGAIAGFHRQLHAGTEVKYLEWPIQIIRDFTQQFDSRKRQPRTVATIGHSYQLDFIMLSEFAVSFCHSLLAFGAGNTGIIFYPFTIQYRYFRQRPVDSEHIMVDFHGDYVNYRFQRSQGAIDQPADTHLGLLKIAADDDNFIIHRISPGKPFGHPGISSSYHLRQNRRFVNIKIWY